MSTRHSLRVRIAATFCLLALLLCVGFAAMVELAVDRFEDGFVRETLSETLDQMISERRRWSDWPMPRTPMLNGYASGDGDMGALPAAVRDLADGFFEYEVGELEYQVGVRTDGQVRYVLTYDATVFDRHEENLARIVSIAVVAFSVAALGLGVWTANRILAPVTSLARQIRTLGRDAKAAALDVQWGNDEVAQLAVAFEQYQQRVQDLLHREREFTGNVSHELRTPIMVASSSVELLLTREDLDEATLLRVRQVSRALRQMTNLVDAFLILGRDSGSTSSPEIPIEVEAPLREIVEFQRETAQRKALQLRLVIRGRPTVVAPRTVVSVVLDNLVRNALAYTDRGGVSVRLDDDGVSIEDTGDGIPEDEKDRVFEREFRGRTATSGGAGLGLAIVKALCDRYGWSVSIENNEADGATARVRFSV